MGREKKGGKRGRPSKIENELNIYTEIIPSKGDICETL